MFEIVVKLKDYSRYTQWEENIEIFIRKTLPDHNLRREFAVGAVAVISHNIWKSKLYINTEGQLFWYLNAFEG